MKKTYIYLTLIFSSLLISCVEEITPNYEFKEQVFISGLLTSEDRFASVQIQKTVQVTDSTINPVNNAKVSLFTRAISNTVSLVSDSFIVDNGDYTTSNSITPIIGNTYWVEVVLEDETVLKSEEELLKPPIPILGMEKTNDQVRITFSEQIEAQEFYLFIVEVFEDDELISSDLYTFNDTIINENSEEYITIGGINDGATVKVSIFNINFNTFQFYNNVLGVEDDFLLSSLSLPRSIVGNVTNITTNKLALGNFGISGFSTLTTEF